MKDIKKIILSFALFLSGCGFYPPQSTYIDPEFVQYVDEYKQDKFFYLNSNKILGLSITFKKIPDHLDGQCSISGIENKITNKTIVQYRAIYINPNNWKYLNLVQRKVLIYHELGHCDLNLHHSNTVSIMNSHGLSDYLFDSSQDFYLDLLFNKGI